MGENIYDKTSEITIKGNGNHKIQFTGIVVTYNEESHLHDCLKSLAFCDQLIVIDLGSTDNSVNIAEQCGAEVKHHNRKPIVEQIRKDAIDYTEYEWVIFLDPDEIFPLNIDNDLRSMINKDSNLGAIKIPWRFFFKGKQLDFSIWGMEKSKNVVLNKYRNCFKPYIHKSIQLLEGYTVATLSKDPEHFIKHYWMDSYAQLFKKHWRYIKIEGESKYRIGKRFSWKIWLGESIATLKRNLFDYHGLRGGFLGIFLSSFHAWYVSMSLLSLRKYQKYVERNRRC